MDNLISVIKKVKSEPLIIAVLLLPINILLQFIKWKVISESMLNVTDNHNIWYSLFYGFPAGLITPLRVGEFAARKIPYENAKLSDVILASLFDKLVPLIVVLLIGGLAAALFIHFYYNTAIVLIVLVALIVFIISYFLFHKFLNEKYENNKLFLKIKESKLFSRYIQNISVLKKVKKDIFIKVFLLSVILYVVSTIQFALLIGAFAKQFDLIQFFWISNLVMFAKTIIPPITFGEVGVREAVTIFFLGKFNINIAVGFNAALLIFLINFVIPSVLGALVLFKGNKK